MSAFIALQDLWGKKAPRAVAFEKSTGVLKIFNERFINVFIHVTDYKSKLSVQAISSRGAIIHDKFVKFGGNFVPVVDVKRNASSFSLCLNCSSEKHNSFFYIVASWLTSQGKVRFVVSSALAVYSKNTIYDQSHDDHCSYVSLNHFDHDNIHQNENGQIELSLYLTQVLLFSKRDLQQSYLVHQAIPLDLMNHRDAVSSAVLDIIEREHLVVSDLKAYTVVQRVSQSITLEYSGSSEVLKTTNIRTILMATASDIPNSKISLDEALELEFSLRGARSKGQLLGKRKIKIDPNK
jgi:hypothetical protein